MTLERVPLTMAEAKHLTEEIRLVADQLWTLLLEAHERHAWKVLGYPSWDQYVAVEFEMSRSRSYQLLDQGRVIRAIADAAEVSTLVDKIDIPERVARELKPDLAAVAEDIRAR